MPEPFKKYFGTGCRINPFFQLLSKQLRLAITERSDRLRVITIILRSFRKLYRSCSHKTPTTDITRTPTDIPKIVGMDIKLLKALTMPCRPPLEERIEDCFPCCCMTPCRICQNAVKIEDHRVKVAPFYRHCC